MSTSKQTDLERYHANALWFGKHYAELKSLYPDQWVGVRNKKVVGAHKDAEQLMIELKSKGISLKTVFFDFVHAEEKVWVFTPIFQ